MYNFAKAYKNILEVKLALKKYFILLITMFLIFSGVNIIGTDSLRKIYIDGDGSGHYAYLPSLLIYKTVDFTDVFEVEKSRRPQDYMGHYFHKYGDIYINKYTSGTAMLQLPFFVISYLLSILFGFETDGYNVIFQYCIAFSALFWVGLGMIFLVKFLHSYGIRRNYGWIMSFVCLLGTNLFFYTFVQPSFSHAYSFSLISIFVFYVRHIFHNYTRNYVYIAAFILGLIVLVRPANLIVIGIIPFLAGDFKVFISTIKNKVINLDFIPAICVFIIAISPQLIINYLQTGSLIIYGYKNEGFYFSDPQFINFLLSYKKGWLIYTPFFFLLFPTSLYLWQKVSKYSFFAFWMFFILLVSVFSSWWNWYYGDSFGMRPMVDYYSIFILVITLGIFSINKKWISIITIIFIGLVVMLNIVQTFQYAVGIIHPDSMTKAGYWHVFLNIDRKNANCISGSDETFYGKINNNPFHTSKTSILKSDEGWTRPCLGDNKIWVSDSMSAKQNKECIYSPSYKFTIPDSLIGYGNIYIKYSTSYFEEYIDAALQTVFVVDIRNNEDESVFYKTFKLKRLPDNSAFIWKEGSIGFKLPIIGSDMDYIKFYLWNTEEQSYNLDNIKVELYTYD